MSKRMASIFPHHRAHECIIIGYCRDKTKLCFAWTVFQKPVFRLHLQPLVYQTATACVVFHHLAWLCTWPVSTGLQFDAWDLSPYLKIVVAISFFPFSGDFSLFSIFSSLYDLCSIAAIKGDVWWFMQRCVVHTVTDYSRIVGLRRFNHSLGSDDIIHLLICDGCIIVAHYFLLNYIPYST